MTLLERLAVAIESGALGQFRNLDSEFGKGNGIYAKRAYNGSLDAAKALHDAVLPGWQINIAFLPVGADVVCGIYGPLDPNAGKWAFAPKFEARAANPARAWLLAIVRALIAQESQNEHQ